MENEHRASEKVREGRKAYEELKSMSKHKRVRKRVVEQPSKFERIKEKAKEIGLSAKERIGTELRERQRKDAEMKQFRGKIEATAYKIGRYSHAQSLSHERGKIQAREEAVERKRKQRQPHPSMSNYMLTGLSTAGISTSKQARTSFISSPVSNYLGFPSQSKKATKRKRGS